jgi:hypothetical protein
VADTGRTEGTDAAALHLLENCGDVATDGAAAYTELFSESALEPMIEYQAVVLDQEVEHLAAS